MSKKVVLTIPHLSGGGAERVVSVWASQLAGSGLSVHILVSGRVGNEYPISDKVAIHHIADTYEEYNKLKLLQKIKIRRAVLKHIKPDYVVSFLPHIQIQTFLATIGMKLKRIETIRVSPWSLKFGKLNRILWNLCINTSYALILQTAEQGLFFPTRVQKKSIVIPNPINDLYRHTFKHSQINLVQRFIAVGRITPQKNYPMMIRAFAQVCKDNPSIILDIFGEADSKSYKTSIEELIQTLGMGNHIHLCGRSNSIHEEYISHDAFLMSSNFEGMPNALLEAMACGMVCLSTKCKTGPKDMIDNGKSGYLVDVADECAFAKTLMEIVKMSQSERQLMGQCARETIMKVCSSEASIRKLESIFS